MWTNVGSGRRSPHETGALNAERTVPLDLLIMRIPPVMRKAYAAFLEQLKEQLLGASGSLPVEVRRDIIQGRILEGALNAFVVRVRANATSVSQADIDLLKADGASEDDIFEAAVCAAYVAGAERFEAGLRAMKGPSGAS
jgi:hypothetical protein